MTERTGTADFNSPVGNPLFALLIDFTTAQLVLA
jgi:hypothetical protein